jgi:hypothetical protein
LETVRARRTDAVRLLLLQETVRVDLVYANGVIPPIVAADIGMIEIVSELVAKGANISAEIKGWTPVRLAMLRQHTTVVEIISSFNGISLDESKTDRAARVVIPPLW